MALSSSLKMRSAGRIGLESSQKCKTWCSTPVSRCRSRLQVSNVSTSSSTTSTTVSEERTATVQVDLGHAAEQAVVRLTHPNSRLVEATMQFPLGLILENVDGQVVVTEVNDGSAAAKADCRVSDVVLATTAFTMQMTYPTMNLMFGGVGRPKLVKMLVPTDKVPFSKVMEAVRSNTPDQGGDGSITLVLERIDSNGGGNGSNGSSNSTHVSEVAEVAEAQAGQTSDALFDPRIFNSTFE